MAAPGNLWFYLLSLSLLLRVQPSACLDPAPTAVGESLSQLQQTSILKNDGGVEQERRRRRRRREEDLLPVDQPFRRLQQVLSNGKPCILFRARKLAIRYQNHSLVDLTERAFSPEHPADTKGSVCSKNKAMLVMRFGDVEDLRSLSIKLQMSSTFYESAGQTWFSVDSISLHYNWSEEACFNASELYAPSTSSYHCQHVSSLPRYNTLLLPTSSSSDNARHWHITFTDFQIQAFNVMSGKFAPASDCATFFTPGILMGLITSLILLLVLAYALHMVIHLKHIDHDDQHKTTVYFPCSPEQAERRSVSNASDAEKNML